MEEDNMGMPGRKPLNFRKDVIPSMNRRMRCHDYSQPGYYLITDSICDYIPRLSKVVGKPFKPVGYVGNGSGQVPMLPAGPIRVIVLFLNLTVIWLRVRSFLIPAGFCLNKLIALRGFLWR